MPIWPGRAGEHRFRELGSVPRHGRGRRCADSSAAGRRRRQPQSFPDAAPVGSAGVSPYIAPNVWKPRPWAQPCWPGWRWACGKAGRSFPPCGNPARFMSREKIPTAASSWTSGTKPSAAAAAGRSNGNFFSSSILRFFGNFDIIQLILFCCTVIK